MAAFICRMCGAPLELRAGDRICKCSACGAVQTVPLIDSEDKAEMCASAERYRREYRYDKAIALYEELIRAYPTDADLYWSMLLCRYGVEYIADGGEHRISLNRTSARSLLADEDYRTALRYADSQQRSLMTAGATEIDNVRRRIVELSRGGERYEIYLCCRERDERGMRTPDYAAAKDIYNRLTAEGFRVFFPELMLEDVSGSELEPYIYAALDSARIMIVVGMSEESFSDVWVSNAYSRFARIAAEDSRRVLIPMLRGMGADALPELLKPYQALDMSRLGYVNDLVTSVCNILGRRTAPVQQTDVRNDPILRRAYLQLEDGEYAAAVLSAHKLLEDDPGNAEAHLVLLMAEYRTSSLDSLGVDFSVSENYRNAMRCGGEGFRLRLRGLLNSSMYAHYKSLLEDARSEKTCREAAEGFRMLGDYSDSASLAASADALADELHASEEQARLEQTYSRCLAVFSNTSSGTTELMHAERTFRELGDFRDSKALADKCRRRIEKINAEIRAIEAGFYTDSGALSRKVVVIIAVSVATVILLASLLVLFALHEDREAEESRLAAQTTVTTIEVDEGKEILNQRYKYDDMLDDIESRIEDGAYEEALAMLDGLSDDCTERQAQRAKFLRATTQMELGHYETAKLIFAELTTYPGSKDGFKECNYRYAKQLIEAGNISIAEDILRELEDYSDAQELLNDILYERAVQTLDSGDREAARKLFGELGDFRNAPEYFGMLSCERAEELMSEGDGYGAIGLLVEAWDYPLAKEMYPEYCFKMAENYLAEGNEWDAVTYLEYGIPYDETGKLAQCLCDTAMNSVDDANHDYFYPKWYLSKLYKVEGYEEQAVSGFCRIAQKYYDKGDYREVIELLNKYKKFDEAAALYDKARQALAQEDSGVQTSTAAPSTTAPAMTTNAPTTSASVDEPTLTNAFAQQLVANCGVGSVFTFGSYEQDGNVDNGAESIEWVVFANDGEKLHAVSVNSLFQTSFGRSGSWANSTLREELNGWFLETAFTEEERQCLTGADTSTGDPYYNDLVRVIDTNSFALIPDEYRISPMSEALQDEAEYSVDDPASWCVAGEQPHIPLIIHGSGLFVHAEQDDLDKDILTNVRVVITISAE